MAPRPYRPHPRSRAGRPFPLGAGRRHLPRPGLGAAVDHERRAPLLSQGSPRQVRAAPAGRLRGADAPGLRRWARGVSQKLALCAGPPPAARVPGAGTHRDRSAPAPCSWQPRRRRDWRRAPGYSPPDTPSGAGRRPGALPHERGGAAGLGRGRGAQPDPHRALPRPRAVAGPSELSRALSADARGPAAPGHSLLPHAVLDPAARALGGDRGHQLAGRHGPPVSRARGAHAARPQVRSMWAVKPGRGGDSRTALLFLAPALLVLAVVTIYPAIWLFWLSLQQRIPVFGIARFAGLDHYQFLAGD